LCSFYGSTLAETNLGKALKDIPREKFVLSTKVGRYGQDVFDFSAERVTRSVDESLARLNVDYIDIIQCHDIEYGSLDQVSSSREEVVCLPELLLEL
jgi:L-galactose dehydrogenase